MDMSENIVKQTAKALGMTYKQLGDAVGYSEGAIKTSISTDKVSEPLKKAIELYLENLELKQEIEKVHTFKNLLKDLIK